ncbi:LptF/LptG family permease [Candidatus Pelagibacter sp.]|nr:LptF/LptG family permease [Candidatus Pelagibacter sp.]MDC1050132.1 LptF/LptG family permease [Candidatus Pelagibacter sp.]
MKTYIKFLINLFNSSFFKVFAIFFIIIFILNILEQVEFFKNTNLSFLYLSFLSFLNTPSIVFEILPFIFLLATQLFFINLIDKSELEIFKYNGLDNLKIIKILSIYSLILGIIFIVFFYNISSVLKNSFLLIKNSYTKDDKYLAVITENGLWIKDEINNNINIVNAIRVDNEFLLEVTITQFNKAFQILRIIKSEKVDISSYDWIIIKPRILEENVENLTDQLILTSNFDLEKINTLFSNLYSLNIYDLIKLKRSYKSLNYSVIDLDSHLYKILSYPVYLVLITVFSAIIMLNVGYRRNTFFTITYGVFLSVVIYYVNYFLNILGTNEKIPLFLSISLPLIILSIINFTSIIKLNEK